MKSFRSFILEMTYSKMKSMYDEINKKAFDNQLPEVKITISNKLTKSSGIAKAKILAGEIQGQMEIVISDLYEMDDEQLKSVIAHEMVHIWMYMQKKFKEAHGPYFRTKAREVGNKLGLDVPKSNDVTGLKITRPHKETGIFVFNRSDVNYTSVIFISATSYKKNHPGFIYKMAGTLASYYSGTSKISDVKMYIVSSNIPYNYSMQDIKQIHSTPRKMRIYKIVGSTKSAVEVEDAIKNATPVITVPDNADILR